MRSRIIYIENKSSGLSGPARIGRVTFSKSGSSIYYRGLRLQTLSGSGFKAKYCDVDSGDEYWVSGFKKDGSDTLYGGIVAIDEDVREEYWLTIRALPAMREHKVLRSNRKYAK